MPFFSFKSRFCLLFLFLGLLIFSMQEQSASASSTSRGLVVSSHEISKNGDIVGTIRNDFRYSYQNIVIGIDLFDTQGNRITRITGYASSSLLRPKKQTRFEVAVPYEWQGKYSSYQIAYVMGNSIYEPKFL